MSERIEVGDLVVVVRGQPCCGIGNSSEIFTVASIYTKFHKCSFCGTASTITKVKGAHHTRGYQLGRLKRIPPLSELESIDHKEEIPA